MKGQVKETSQVCDFGSHFLPKSEEVQGWGEQSVGCQLNVLDQYGLGETLLGYTILIV